MSEGNSHEIGRTEVIGIREARGPIGDLTGCGIGGVVTVGGARDEGAKGRVNRGQHGGTTTGVGRGG